MLFDWALVDMRELEFSSEGSTLSAWMLVDVRELEDTDNE